MADIAQSDVTYTIQKEREQGNLHEKVVDAAFGDGALTYPTGGVPLDDEQLGVTNENEFVQILGGGDDSNGFVYKVDQDNLKIRIYQGDNDNASDAPLIELAGGVATPAAATVKLLVRGY